MASEALPVVAPGSGALRVAEADAAEGMGMAFVYKTVFDR